MTSYFGDNITLNVSFSNPDIDSCWYEFNSDLFDLSDCEPVVISGLVDGFYNITVFANDTFGFENSSNVFFSIDNSMPSLDLSLVPSNNSFIGVNTPFIINVSSESGSIDRAQYNIGSGWVDFSNNEEFFPFSENLNSGSVSISFRGVSSSGLVNSSNIFEYELDLTPPSIVLNNDFNEVFNQSNNLTLNFSVSNVFGEGIDSVWYKLNKRYSVNLEVPDINDSFFLENVTLGVGKNKLILFANDTFGNLNVLRNDVFSFGEVNLSEQRSKILGFDSVLNVSILKPPLFDPQDEIINILDGDDLYFFINLEGDLNSTIIFENVSSSDVFWENNFGNISSNIDDVQDQLVYSVLLDDVLGFVSIFNQSLFLEKNSYNRAYIYFSNVSENSFNSIYYVNNSNVLFLDMCPNEFLQGSQGPCYSYDSAAEDLFLFIDSFSGVVFGNDTSPPSVSILDPTGNTDRYFTPRLLVSRDVTSLDNITMNYSSTDRNEIINPLAFEYYNETHSIVLFEEQAENHEAVVSLSFSVFDGAGNLNDSENITFEINDVTPPVINILSPSNNSVETDSSLNLEVEVDEPSLVEYSLNQGAFEVLFSIDSKDLSGGVDLVLSNGDYNLTVRATDLANNIATENISFSVNQDSGSSNGGGSGSGDGGLGGGGAGGGLGGAASSQHLEEENISDEGIGIQDVVEAMEDVIDESSEEEFEMDATEELVEEDEFGALSYLIYGVVGIFILFIIVIVLKKYSGFKSNKNVISNKSPEYLSSKIKDCISKKDVVSAKNYYMQLNDIYNKKDLNESDSKIVYNSLNEFYEKIKELEK
ncbi:MAG: hypothetical protein ACMXX7_02900 [Candidatus Woesearchaeota archaeon]